MNDILKMYGSIGSEIMNRYFVVAMCFKRQPRWRRLQTINKHKIKIINSLYFLGRNGVKGASYLPADIKFDPSTKTLQPVVNSGTNWIDVCSRKDKACLSEKEE